MEWNGMEWNGMKNGEKRKESKNRKKSRRRTLTVVGNLVSFSLRRGSKGSKPSRKNRNFSISDSVILLFKKIDLITGQEFQSSEKL
jgi:hypothetical protein